MLIATRAVLRGINAGSATADGEAIDRVSGIVFLSEGLAFDGWDELWVGFWESGRDEIESENWPRTLVFQNGT
jgi:hypothetical protein